MYHRIDNIFTMSGPRFFSLAYRIPIYGGQVNAVAQREQEEAQRHRPGGPVRPGAVEVPAEAALAMISDGRAF